MAEGRRGGANSYRVLSGGAADPLMLAGTADPSAGGGVSAPAGSIYMQYVSGAGKVYVKTGDGDTAWTYVDPSGGTPQLAYGHIYTPYQFTPTAYFSGNYGSWAQCTQLFRYTGALRDVTVSLVGDWRYRFNLPARDASWFVAFDSFGYDSAEIDGQVAIYLNSTRQDNLSTYVHDESSGTPGIDDGYVPISLSGVVEASAGDTISVYGYRNGSTTYLPTDVYYASLTITELG